MPCAWSPRPCAIWRSMRPRGASARTCITPEPAAGSRAAAARADDVAAADRAFHPPLQHTARNTHHRHRSQGAQVAVELQLARQRRRVREPDLARGRAGRGRYAAGRRHSGTVPGTAYIVAHIQQSGELSIKKASRTIEETLICRARDQTCGNHTGAVRLLEISDRALQYKIKDY